MVQIIEQNPDSPSPTKFVFRYKVLSKSNPKSKKMTKHIKEMITYKPNYVILKGDLVAHISVYREDINNLNKVDVDNLAKSCLDAFKGILFEDDNQIKLLIISKHYFEKNKAYGLLEYYSEEKYNKIIKLYDNRFPPMKRSIRGKVDFIEV